MAAEPQPPTPTTPISDLVTLFLSSAKVKPSTRALYARHLAKMVKAFGVTAKEVRTGALVKWFGELKVGPTTRGIVQQSVSAFFGWCVRSELIAKNPAARIPKPPAASRGREAIVSPGDMAKLLEAVSPALRTFLRLLHATGARPGELCALTAADFDAASGVAVLKVHKADRTGKPRLIFFPPEAAAVVQTLVERFPEGPLLRNAKGKPWKPKDVASVVWETARRLKLRIVPYAFRHTFATDALAAGVPDAHVAALLGHSSTAMLHKHYSHITNRSRLLREAAAKVRA